MTFEEYGVLCAAKSHLGVKEKTPNWGEMIALYLKKVGHTTPQPWCAAAVSYVGWHALHDPTTDRSQWPMPLTAGCKQLGEWAEAEGVLVDEGRAGMVYLLHYASYGRFAHTGFLLAPTGEPNEWFVLDGNTNKAGGREGFEYACKRRVIDPAEGHRFVDWVQKLNRG